MSLGRERRRATRIDRRLRARRERARLHYTRVRRRPGLALSRRSRALLLGGSLLAGTAAALVAGEPALLFARREAISLRAIAVQGNRRLDAAAIARATGVAPGAALEEIHPEAVEARLRAHPWVRDARAALLPTGRLIVGVAEREPRAVLASADAGRWQWVDADGTPFAEATEEEASSALRIVAPAALAPSPLRALLAEALALGADWRALSQAPLRTVRAPAPDSTEGWVLELAAPELDAVLGERDLFHRLEQLARLLAAELPETRRSPRVDLRFEGRAVLASAARPAAAALQGGVAASR